MRSVEGLKGAGSWVFSQLRGVDSGRAGKRKARSQEGFSGQMIAASRRRRAKAVVVGEIRRVLVGLRSGESGGREPFWDSRSGRSGHLTAGVTGAPEGGRARGVRMAVEGVL